MGPEIRYDADVSPPGWNQWRADFDQFERPVPKARRVWFDFFRPYYEWYTHLDGRGQFDDDYPGHRSQGTGRALAGQLPLLGERSHLIAELSPGGSRRYDQRTAAQTELEQLTAAQSPAEDPALIAEPPRAAKTFAPPRHPRPRPEEPS